MKAVVAHPREVATVSRIEDVLPLVELGKLRQSGNYRGPTSSGRSPHNPNCDSLRSECRAEGRNREAVDHPDLAGEGDHVSFVPNELERSRLVQTAYDHGKGAVPVDLDERAGVRHRKIQQFSIRVERAVRE